MLMVEEATRPRYTLDNSMIFVNAPPAIIAPATSSVEAYNPNAIVAYGVRLDSLSYINPVAKGMNNK